MNALTLALQELIQAIETDDPINLNDEDLAEFAQFAAEELRRRYPRYALEQGDLDNEDEVEKREELVAAVVRFRSH